ncbi:MAG: anti-sigma factor RsbA family regulatory protein [Frankia sp.]
MLTGEPRQATAATGLAHEVLTYHGESEFLAGVTSFVGEGLADSGRVVVALGSQNIVRLRAALGVDGRNPGLTYLDVAELGRNPARTIPAWREFALEDGDPGRPFSGVCEWSPTGRPPAEVDAVCREEALLNVAFAAERPWRLLCLYDATALDGPILAGADSGHPYLRFGGAVRDNPAYLDAGAGQSTLAGPLPEPPAVADRLTFTGEGLAETRVAASRRAREAGFGRDRADDLALAVHEIATNSVLHGGGVGVLRVWTEPGAVVCEISDRGWLRDPLVGRSMPEPGEEGGRGLWLANQLCDLVQVRSRPGRTVIRLSLREPRPPAA